MYSLILVEIMLDLPVEHFFSLPDIFFICDGIPCESFDGMEFLDI